MSDKMVVVLTKSNRCNGNGTCVDDGLSAYQQSANACNISDVVAQIDYIVKRIGIDHVGIGGDFDGKFIKNKKEEKKKRKRKSIDYDIGISLMVQGLEDVSKYPFLFSALVEKGYKDGDINKVPPHLSFSLLLLLFFTSFFSSSWSFWHLLN